MNEIDDSEELKRSAQRKTELAHQAMSVAIRHPRDLLIRTEQTGPEVTVIVTDRSFHSLIRSQLA